MWRNNGLPSNFGVAGMENCVYPWISPGQIATCVSLPEGAVEEVEEGADRTGRSVVSLNYGTIED